MAYFGSYGSIEDMESNESVLREQRLDCDVTEDDIPGDSSIWCFFDDDTVCSDSFKPDTEDPTYFPTFSPESSDDHAPEPPPPSSNNDSNSCYPTTASECRVAAESIGLSVGGAGYPFAGAWPIAGCYYYACDHCHFGSSAFFGTRGTEEEMRQPIDSGEPERRLSCDSTTEEVLTYAPQCQWTSGVCSNAMLATDFPTLGPGDDAKEYPDDCANISIHFETDTRTGDDITVWELINESSGLTVKQGGPLAGGTSFEVRDCIPHGKYTFHINDSRGDGIGSFGSGGYVIESDGAMIGTSKYFFDDEEMSFELPFDPERAGCADEFFVAIGTDNNPGDTTWKVIDTSNGDLIFSGGPYEKKAATFQKRACFPRMSSKPTFLFTISDSQGDGLCCDDGNGFYVLAVNLKTISEGGDFGQGNFTIFTLDT